MKLKKQPAKSHSKKIHGFGIMEVVIGFALLSVLVMVLLQITGTINKTQKNAQNNIDFDIAKSSIQMILRNSRACKNTFRDSSSSALSFNASSPTYPIDVHHLDLAGGSFLSMATPNLGAGLILTRMQIVSGVSEGTITRGTNTFQKFLVKFEIEASKGAAAVGPNTLKTEFLVSILVSSGNQVAECGGNWSSSADMCASDGGVYDEATDTCDDYKGQVATLKYIGVKASELNNPCVVVTGVSTVDCGDVLNTRKKPGTSSAVITDTSSNSGGSNVSRTFFVFDQVGPDSAFVDTNPAGGVYRLVIAQQGDWIGIGCNADDGWHLLSCSHYVDGNNEDTLTYRVMSGSKLIKEGCRSNDYFNNDTMGNPGQDLVLTEMKCIKTMPKLDVP